MNRCLSGRTRYTLEREDGRRQVLETGHIRLEFVYVPGGTRHEIETVGEEPHRTLSGTWFDAVTRMEAFGNTSGTDGSDGLAEGDADTLEWQGALFVDRKRDEVVAKNDDFASE